MSKAVVKIVESSFIIYLVLSGMYRSILGHKLINYLYNKVWNELNGWNFRDHAIYTINTLFEFPSPMSIFESKMCYSW